MTAEEQKKQLSLTTEYHLRKQQALGMSYGSKAFAQVVYDKYKPYITDDFNVETLTDEEKNMLLNDVYHFIKTTLDVSIQSIEENLMRIKEKTNKFTQSKE